MVKSNPNKIEYDLIKKLYMQYPRLIIPDIIEQSGLSKSRVEWIIDNLLKNESMPARKTKNPSGAHSINTMPPTQEQLDRLNYIAYLRSHGWKWKQIAAKLNMKTSSVFNYVRRHKQKND